VIGLLALGPILLFYAWAIEPYWIEVTRHDVGEGPRDVVILHLTDLHFSEPGSRERRVLEILAETKPDLIVITGDSILRDYNQAAFTEFLSQLHATLGIYACLGNWEERRSSVPNAPPARRRRRSTSGIESAPVPKGRAAPYEGVERASGNLLGISPTIRAPCRDRRSPRDQAAKGSPGPAA